MRGHQAIVNTAKTAVLLAAMGGLFIAAGAWLGSATGALIGLFVGLAMVGGSYWFSDRLAIKAAGARPLTEAEAPFVYEIVRSLADRAELPMPLIYLSPSLQPNAFATGRDPEHAAVCVTEGLLPLLDRDELEGVLAHEMSHVANRDILIGSIAAALAMALTMVPRFAIWASMLGGGRRRYGSGPLAVFGFIAMSILAPLAAGVLQAAIGRSREFEADRSGALLAGTGQPLARALMKIDAAAQRTRMDIDLAQATAYILNPLSGRQIQFGRMFRTHPSTIDRIARLNQTEVTHDHIGAIPETSVAG